MNRTYEIYDQVKEALKVVLPEVFADYVRLRSSIEALPEFVNEREAADALGVKKPQIKQWIAEKKLPTHLVGDYVRPRIYKQDLAKLVKEIIKSSR